MNLATVIRSEEKWLLPTYDRQKVLFEKGRGLYFWDSRGNRYLQEAGDGNHRVRNRGTGGILDPASYGSSHLSKGSVTANQKQPE